MKAIEAISFRPAQGDDLDFLRKLRAVTMREVVLRHHMWIEDEQEKRVRIGLDGALIVRSGESDIGVLKVIRAADHLRLLQIQLLPEYQGRGIGTELIKGVQAECAAIGHPLMLHVYRSNRALELYGRLGFGIVDQSADTVMMRWDPKRPNQAPEPTSTAVMPPADAGVTPSALVAHL